MPVMKQTTLRLSASQLRTLDRLSRKLELDRSNVIRLAITRLAEQEGILRAPRE